jgi:transcriptional regulator NrdR family protein
VRHSARVLQPFSRDKLFMSLYESCKHRPTALTDADGLTSTVTHLLLQQLSEGSIGREEIIMITTAVLERFDRTAATIYSAYHAV